MTGAATGYTPVSAVGGSLSLANATATTKAAEAASGSTLDKDAFLKLLVAQLKYQDPSKPMDSDQFMAQTAQFTSVEKLEALNTTQSSMLQSQNYLAASSLVGQTITYPTADNTDATGVVTSAVFSSDGPVLRVGDKDVPLTAVKSVAQTKA
ncbi:flagellar basal-body rod modification protein FlgD [Motilibacter rhizosphaerae]|uniref:Flagellar basal-body rod modification protein FlgD n=1 Tax=Motilibacter rhizosphaerae TaxID=598652 RepID=A0A4Q7NVW6_9ACTN|nr:flagellar hook capping FlgD N-terminal domain-containing protein [Motilibacter rhizosphaerae]RZS91423.1 flagellar basal-body rod modification protein FlgD [Motilibacter rhizosphaerae]